MNGTEKQAPPFVIWTMQRTGGTNFTNRLIAMSGLPAHHEPFNRPRSLGSLSRDWEADRDIEALTRQMDEVLAEPKVIKHCVEMVPWRVSAVLAERSAMAGYGQLFLVRESSLQRLLSMEYARRTKVWGPGHEKPDENEDPAFETPLNVEELAAHETRGIEMLNQFWRRLKRAKAPAKAITFEQIYDSPFEEACERIEQVIDHLSLERNMPVEELLEKMRDMGNQKTSDRYGRFTGIGELAEVLKQKPDYVFL